MKMNPKKVYQWTVLLPIFNLSNISSLVLRRTSLKQLWAKIFRILYSLKEQRWLMISAILGL